MILQPPLIKSDRRRCVLCTVADARQRLRDWNVDEDDIKQLIEEGFLVAWNISLRATGHRRRVASSLKTPIARDWRILPDSIDHFERTGGHRQFPMTGKQILDKIFEGQGAMLATRELANLLNCGPEHVTHLYDAGELGRRSDYGRGPGNGASFTREAIIKFLNSRMEGGL